jgi:hypothetical protein
VLFYMIHHPSPGAQPWGPSTSSPGVPAPLMDPCFDCTLLHLQRETTLCSSPSRRRKIRPSVSASNVLVPTNSRAAVGRTDL